MAKKITVNTFMEKKAAGEKITAVTSYDYCFTKIINEAGIDMILVGDSLGMVVQGHTSTIPVTMEDMIYHTRMVSRAEPSCMIVGDMPFMAYQADTSEAVRNAGRLLKEGFAESVKLEGGADVADSIYAICRAGIPVQAHIGLTPQSVHQMGGFKVQRDEERLVKDAHIVEEAGAFSVVLEGIPANIASRITKELKIPTIGIGAGVDCDGQILVMHDLLGLNMGHIPKFAKKYSELGNIAVKSFQDYISEVKNGSFPGDEHSFK
ncbi:MAG: 3-methyl-2-oxobutanoate hydroxymethyltransferase [Deltaproteobacteria bacterium]|nr:MAG: 3-methyl-2-oxobutanoate hydroxymethyltransferase [Deltaproteobacteria bacterium]